MQGLRITWFELPFSNGNFPSLPYGVLLPLGQRIRSGSRKERTNGDAETSTVVFRVLHEEMLTIKHNKLRNSVVERVQQNAQKRRSMLTLPLLQLERDLWSALE